MTQLKTTGFTSLKKTIKQSDSSPMSSDQRGHSLTMLSYIKSSGVRLTSSHLEAFSGVNSNLGFKEGLVAERGMSMSNRSKYEK